MLLLRIYTVNMNFRFKSLHFVGTPMIPMVCHTRPWASPGPACVEGPSGFQAACAGSPLLASARLHLLPFR